MECMLCRRASNIWNVSLDPQCLQLPGRADQVLAQRQSVPSQKMRLFDTTATKTTDLVFPYQPGRLGYSW